MTARPPATDDASLFDDAADFPPASQREAGRTATVEPAPVDDDLRRLARRLSALVHLGTSSWSFPGWQGIVYEGPHAESLLARGGLRAYAAHPLLRAVGVDRSFYQPLAERDYAHYAEQVPPSFRFVVKAPAQVTDAVVRGDGGVPDADNPQFLDPTLAAEQFVVPALRGLGDRAGPLVFQLSPLPRRLLGADGGHALIERIGRFLESLPRNVDSSAPVYAVELRNAELLTPRFVKMLSSAGARLCIGVHARMPPAPRQGAALRAMDAGADEGEHWTLKGPLVARWSLHSGLRYDDAKNRYAPFDRLIDADIPTRGTLAHLIHVSIRSAQPAYVIVNNKAEGSAPLSCIELARAVAG